VQFIDSQSLDVHLISFLAYFLHEIHVRMSSAMQLVLVRRTFQRRIFRDSPRDRLWDWHLNDCKHLNWSNLARNPSQKSSCSRVPNRPLNFADQQNSYRAIYCIQESFSDRGNYVSGLYADGAMLVRVVI